MSEAYDERHRIGGGVSAGVVANITDNWKWFASGGYLGYLFGHRSDDVKISVGQRWTFAKNFAFRTTFTHHDRDNELLCLSTGISNYFQGRLEDNPACEIVFIVPSQKFE